MVVLTTPRRGPGHLRGLPDHGRALPEHRGDRVHEHDAQRRQHRQGLPLRPGPHRELGGRRRERGRHDAGRADRRGGRRRTPFDPAAVAITGKHPSGTELLQVTATSGDSATVAANATTAAQATVDVVVASERYPGTPQSKIAGTVVSPGGPVVDHGVQEARWWGVLGAVAGFIVSLLACSLLRPGRWSRDLAPHTVRSRRRMVELNATVMGDEMRGLLSGLRRPEGKVTVGIAAVDDRRVRDDRLHDLPAPGRPGRGGVERGAPPTRAGPRSPCSSPGSACSRRRSTSSSSDRSRRPCSRWRCSSPCSSSCADAASARAALGVRRPDHRDPRRGHDRRGRRARARRRVRSDDRQLPRAPHGRGLLPGLLRVRPAAAPARRGAALPRRRLQRGRARRGGGRVEPPARRRAQLGHHRLVDLRRRPALRTHAQPVGPAADPAALGADAAQAALAVARACC